MSIAQRLSSAARRLGRWPIALAAIAVVAAAMLLPGLGDAGVWEPQERALVDRVAPPQAVEAERAVQQIQQSAAALGELAKLDPQRQAQRADRPDDPCVRTAPRDAIARTLGARVLRFGRDELADSDAGRRLPFAVFGLITVLAAAGVAMRLAGARAGRATGLVLLAMPLLAVQARLLTSELGTACGCALIVYGLVALARLHRARGIRGMIVLALDAALAVLALGAGALLGFVGGGALLGLVVPIGAFAAAGSLGVPLIAAIARGGERRWGLGLAALIATLVAAALIGLLAYQLYDLRPPYPGITPPARQLLGKAIVPTGCWSWALGASWRPEDDYRFVFDSTFEQIAYGTFPWGALAPIAMAMLLRDPDRERRFAGALALAWAGGAWIASEAFQRRVGFTVWAAFPALAIAVGVWLDGVLARRARREPDALPAGALLIALYAVLATAVLGKDMVAFAEKVTSLTTGPDASQYPAMAKLLWVPTKAWPLIIGGLVALGLAAALTRPAEDEAPRWRHTLAAWGAAVAFGATALLAAFWPFAWHPSLAQHLSSKEMFETYRELRGPGDDLVIMGDLGTAPRAYADAEAPQWKLEPVASRDQIVAALKRPNRVFAIAPQAEICSLHREIGEKPYFVVDDRNARNYLLTNRIAGAEDRNPLREAIVHAEPKGMQARPKGRVTWRDGNEDKIELLGWDLPKRVDRGDRFEVTLYYRILKPVGGNWKSLVHFDGAAGRAGNGDHEPIKGRCPTSTWQPGDFIIDRFTASAGGGAYPAGAVEVFVGFFTGSMPSFRNMQVSEAPSEMRTRDERVKIAGMQLD